MVRLKEHPEARCLKVLCVTYSVNPPFHINIGQPLEILRKRGAVLYTVREDKDVRISDISSHDAVLFFRNFSPKALRYLYYSKLLGKAVLFGVDDNLYELAYSEKKPMEPLQLNAHSRYMREADQVIVYSDLMFEKARLLNSNVEKMAPGINFSTIDGPERKKGDGKVRIVYATSRSRDILSGIFFPAIKRVLSEYSGRVEMDFWGYLPEEFRGFPQVNLVPQMDYNSYLAELSSRGFDIGLAPLMDDPFHRSKTNTKFRDYGACQIAGVYSNVDVYSDCVSDGATGILVENTEESWYKAIKSLIEDRDLLESIKCNAYKFVREHYDMENTARRLHEIIRSTIDRKAEKTKDAHIQYTIRPASRFLDARAPVIYYITTNNDDGIRNKLKEIKKYYGYPIRIKKPSDISIRLLSLKDVVILNAHEGIREGLMEKLSGKPVINVQSGAEPSAADLINKIEDLYYGEIIGGRAEPYRYSLRPVWLYLAYCRRIISFYLFKKTGLNNIEIVLRRKIIKPLFFPFISSGKPIK